MKNNLQNKRRAASLGDERGFNVWLLWAVILIIGLISWGYLDHISDQKRLSISKTESVIHRFEGSVVSLNSQSILAAYGNSGSLDNISLLSRDLQTDMALLQRGGRLSLVDPTPVLALGAYPEIPLSLVNTQYEGFNKSVQVLIGASDQLKKAGDAESLLPQTIEDLRATTSIISQSPSLSSGVWGNALDASLKELTRDEMASVGVIFSPTKNGYDLARQWASSFLSRARELRSLKDLAQKDRNLSASDKELVSKLAQQAQDLAIHARALVETYDARLQARNSLDAIGNSHTALKASIVNLNSSIKNMAVVENSHRYFVWIAIAVSIIGLIGVLRALWSLGYQTWGARSENASSSVVLSALDKVTKQLRKIINLESSTNKLNEDPDSPIFSLVSHINQILGQRDDASSIVSEQASNIRNSIFQFNGASSGVLKANNDQKDKLSSLSSQTHDIAQYLAVACSTLDDIQKYVNDSVNISYKGGAMAQENLWKMESLRENTQGTSKRIKRLGESAQTIGISTDLIKQISRKVKVLALNVAVEASSQGESGRNFTLLARELERLAQNVDMAVKDVDNQITAIQTDAKETVSSMEEGISDVVYSAKISASSGIVFKDLDSSLESAKDNLTEIISGLEQATVSLAKQTDDANEIAVSVTTQGDNMKEANNKLKFLDEVVSEFRKWLLTLGRDI